MLRAQGLRDVSVVLNEDDYPRISRVWKRSENPQVSAPEVLLERDVLDGMVLDLQNRRATRANDLLLQDDRLIAVDVSVRAVLRRLTRGLLGKRSGKVYDWKYVEFLRGDPRGAQDGDPYNMHVDRLPAGDIAVLCKSVPYLHAAELITLLPHPLAAEVLQALPASLQRQVIGELSHSYAVELVGMMAPDLAADLLGRLGRDQAEKFLAALGKGPIMELLHYQADTVGGIMTNDLLVLPEDLTVEEARRVVRRTGPRFVYTVFVTSGGRLKGTLNLVDLVAAPSSQRLGELLNPYIAALACGEPARAAAYRVLQSGLPSWPVLDEEGRLLGSVTEDMALDYVVPAALSEQLPRVLS